MHCDALLLVTHSGIELCRTPRLTGLGIWQLSVGWSGPLTCQMRLQDDPLVVLRAPCQVHAGRTVAALTAGRWFSALQGIWQSIGSWQVIACRLGTMSCQMRAFLRTIVDWARGSRTRRGRWSMCDARALGTRGAP